MSLLEKHMHHHYYIKQIESVKKDKCMFSIICCSSILYSSIKSNTYDLNVHVTWKKKINCLEEQREINNEYSIKGHGIILSVYILDFNCPYVTRYYVLWIYGMIFLTVSPYAELAIVKLIM